MECFNYIKYLIILNYLIIQWSYSINSYRYRYRQSYRIWAFQTMNESEHFRQWTLMTFKSPFPISSHTTPTSLLSQLGIISLSLSFTLFSLSFTLFHSLSPSLSISISSHPPPLFLCLLLFNSSFPAGVGQLLLKLRAIIGTIFFHWKYRVNIHLCLMWGKE